MKVTASRSLCPRARSQTQGNESRLTKARLEDLEQVFGVPGGAFTASFDGAFVCGLANEVEGEVPNDGHILSAMTLSQPRLILVEDHVEGPV